MMCTYNDYQSVVFLIICVCFSIVFISAQPYKSKFSHHNVIGMVFFMIGIIFFCCCYGYNYSRMYRLESSNSLLIFTFILLTLPHAYIAFLVLKWLYVRMPWRRLLESLLRDNSRCYLYSSV